jgi:hypothetical protein
MKTNLSGEFGYARSGTGRRDAHMIEVEQRVLVVERLKRELRDLIGQDAARDFYAMLPDNPWDAAKMLEAELISYECTCGVTWISDPCQGCAKLAEVRLDRVGCVLDVDGF